MTDLTAAFGKPFAQQVAAFRIRLADLRATTGWKDVWQAEHDRAFMVAGAMKADLLADLAAAVDKAITKGTSLDEFRRDFAAAVEAHNWHGWTGETTEKGRAWRTRVIYRTNLSASYAAGRFAQLKEAGFTHWVYLHGNAREPRLQHLAWDGLILPADHPFWASHYPPNGWGCTCHVAGARSERGAIRMGGKPDVKLTDGWDTPLAKTGEPAGIGKGWGYAPGRAVSNTINAIAQKVADLPAPLGSSLVENWPATLYEAWAEEFGAFIDTIKADVPRGRQMFVGALKQEWVIAARAAGVEPASAEIVVREADVRHTFRLSKDQQLDDGWYRQLPVHLRNPQAVLLDVSKPDTPAILLVYGQGDKRPKLVVQVNYWVKKLGLYNVVHTGKVIDPTGIALSDTMKLISGNL